MGSYNKSRTSVPSQVVGDGRLIEVMTVHAETDQNITLLAAELKKGIVTHNSNTGAGTATTDTAANIIAGIPLTVDNQCFKTYFVNIGDQEVTFAGGTNVTIADDAQLCTGDAGVTLIFQRTGAAAVKMFCVGGAPTDDE